MINALKNSCKIAKGEMYCIEVSPFLLVRIRFLFATKQYSRMMKAITKFTDEHPELGINYSYGSGIPYIHGYYPINIQCFDKGTDPKPNNDGRY